MSPGWRCLMVQVQEQIIDILELTFCWPAEFLPLQSPEHPAGIFPLVCHIQVDNLGSKMWPYQTNLESHCSFCWERKEGRPTKPVSTLACLIWRQPLHPTGSVWNFVKVHDPIFFLNVYLATKIYIMAMYTTPYTTTIQVTKKVKIQN